MVLPDCGVSADRIVQNRFAIPAIDLRLYVDLPVVKKQKIIVIVISDDESEDDDMDKFESEDEDEFLEVLKKKLYDKDDANSKKGNKIIIMLFRAA